MWTPHAPTRLGLVLTVSTAGIGCATAAPPPAENAASVAARRQQLDELHQERDQRDARIRELESRLSLAQAEAADLRDEVARRDEDAPPRSAVVRIGEGSNGDNWREPWQEGVWQDSELFGEEAEPPPTRARGPRPVLRLYGERRPSPPVSAGSLGPLQLPAAPSAAVTRLPVVPLPGETEVRSAPTPVNPIAIPVAGPVARPPFLDVGGATSESADPVVAEYQRALRFVRDRRFDEALRSLDRFVEAHGRHPYVQNALYWRGEVHYARHAYGRARAEFEAVVRRFPRGSKAADALLKAGLCHLRTGNRSAATRVFARVRQEYPDSVAARMAAREQEGDLR